MSVISELKSFDPIYSRILKNEREILSNSKLFSACIKGKLLEFIRDDQFTLFSEIAYKHRRSKHEGIRLVTSIDDHHTSTLVEEFLAIGVQVKHITNLLHPIHFVVSDREVLEIMLEENKLSFENDPSRVRYYLNIFDDL